MCGAKEVGMRCGRSEGVWGQGGVGGVSGDMEVRVRCGKG